MKEYKLIKEYPGSPELGIICEERNNKSSFCYYYEGEKNVGILKNEVENQPEYWEEVVENIYYMVSLIDMGFHNAWEPIKVDAIKYDTDTKKYFSTEEGARSFIIFNKPCLSYNDIKKPIQLGYTSEGILGGIYNIVKSRI